jgi:hypothetical protein
MSNRSRALVLAFGLACLGLAPTGCSKAKEKEQCEQVVSAMLAAHEAYGSAQAAAERGNRANFESERKRFDEQLKALEAVKLDEGDSLLSGTNHSTKQRYPEAAKKAMEGWEKLMGEVEKDPKLGQKYAGGIPPIGADYADSHSTASAIAKSSSCPK